MVHDVNVDIWSDLPGDATVDTSHELSLGAASMGNASPIYGSSRTMLSVL